MSNIVLNEQQQFVLEIIKAATPYIVAIIGIVSGIIIPFFTKNLEIEKHKNEIIINNKCNCYKEIYKYLSTILEYPFAFYPKEDWDKLSDDIKKKEYSKINADDNNYDYENYKRYLLNAMFEHQKIQVDKFQEYIKSNGLFISQTLNDDIKILFDRIRYYRGIVQKQTDNVDIIYQQIQENIVTIKDKMRKELKLEKK